MKFSTIFGLFSVASMAFASDAPVEEAPKDAAAAVDFSNLDFSITYQFDGQDASSQVSRLFNEDQVSVTYSFVNNRDIPVSIVGVGGFFKDAQTLEPKFNLTDTAVGPVAVDVNGGKGEFIQKISIDMYPAAYVFAPTIYITYDNTMYVVTPNPSFITVEDHPISVFDPQLLFVLTILIGVFGTVGYFVAVQFAIPYVNKNYLKKNAPKPIKPTVSKKATTSASTTGAKSYDENWLPQGHLKKSSKKK
ncbi:Irc22 protein [Saccharomycopsis crataegensis]|uniref:Increased recombination centers protein 22 n=1 Tax=Saccharomycopsis crataegensis TaxID=43959 RepID=A0AAV5QSM5_9ASCO|nr:Irc22 protein [Saccharomycopsis crataegensis]